jgi:hypothetical protein
MDGFVSPFPLLLSSEPFKDAADDAAGNQTSGVTVRRLDPDDD